MIHVITNIAQVHFKLPNHKEAGMISPLLRLAYVDLFCPHLERCLLYQTSLSL